MRVCRLMHQLLLCALSLYFIHVHLKLLLFVFTILILLHVYISVTRTRNSEVRQKYWILVGHLWSNFILSTSLTKFAEPHKSLEKILEKMWHFFVCFDALVVSASSSSPEAKLTTKTCHIFSRIFFKDLWSSANFVNEMDNINVDQHKILDNFHL